jgi:hypothetical protein
VTSERRELPWLRALLLHPLLAVAGTVLAFFALAVAGASGDAWVTFAYMAPLSVAALATGLAVIRRRRGPVAGLLLSIGTAAVAAAIIGLLVLAVVVLGLSSDSLSYD